MKQNNKGHNKNVSCLILKQLFENYLIIVIIYSYTSVLLIVPLDKSLMKRMFMHIELVSCVKNSSTITTCIAETIWEVDWL